jgi:transcriptional regulator with XRE-family HTH domain
MNKTQEQDRKNHAYELRLKGMSYRQIASSMGVSVGTAHRWVNEYLEAVTLPMVEQVRKQEVDRLMRYLERLDERIDDGDDKAISIALKISERLCKMLGADMPTQHEITKTETTQVDLALRDLIERQKAQNALRLQDAARLREGTSDAPSSQAEDASELGIERIILDN